MSVLKMNWGAKIALLYAGFVALIVVLVAGSMRQDFDLVTPDYYGQEIKYQQVIDAGKNQAALSSPVSIHANETVVTIEFPNEFAEKVLKGNIHFYSPVNAAWDKTVNINTVNNAMTIQRSELKTSNYTIKLDWEADGKKYYQETTLNLR
ncbi:hypothetical protein CAP35_03815 [Chitinophagaceae bacterium IBVUCB1]|nr:hypothetical protein CAP35_03815 [Chitinophagaceae bacterium IBVUCB1]